jgi:hypothetical protein
MMTKRALLALWIVVGYGLGTHTFAQTNSYPKGYFMFPVNPGQPGSLAGVLGDLRTNHFHGGLDIRTQQRIGLPIYAAADGYVYKIAVQTTGYGKVIYLRHPNGMTTVYGHLDTFNAELGAYVRGEQYKRESFEIELYPDSTMFRVKKGSVIARSGNTGSSAGPHLHFEIRDSRDNNLNPLLFGFSEIKDTSPPEIKEVALRPLSIDSRVNGAFERVSFSPLPKSSARPGLPVYRASGLVGIELNAYDRMDGTGFRYGLHCIEVRLDGREVFVYNMEMVPNTVTRDYNNLIDYAYEQENGTRFFKCYVPDGNRYDLFRTNDRFKGRLFIQDTLEHRVTIKVFDTFQNARTVEFMLKGEPLPRMEEARPAEVERPARYVERLVSENILKIVPVGYQSTSPSVRLKGPAGEKVLLPAYWKGTQPYFLHDLRGLLPDSLFVGQYSEALYLKEVVHPNQPTIIRSRQWEAEFDSTSLFDTLYLNVRHEAAFIQIGEAGVPLRHSFKASVSWPERSLHSAQTHLYRLSPSGTPSFTGGTWFDDRLNFSSRSFGRFVLLTDSIPPQVRVIEASKRQIRAKVRDELSGIGGFEARVNEQWVLLNYEYKDGMLESEKLDSLRAFEGELRLRVTDRAGNSTNLQVEIKDPPAANKPAHRKRK